MDTQISRNTPARAAARRIGAGGAVLLLALTLVFPSGAAGMASANEEARYDILVDGQQVGSEKYSITSDPDGISSKSTATFRGSGQKGKKVRMETQMTMDAQYVPRAYELRTDEEGRKGSITGSFIKGEATFAYQGVGNPTRKGLLVPDHYVILDMNVFHHFGFIARQYDFNRGGMQPVEVVIPQELDIGTLKLEEVGVEMIRVGGKTMGLHHLRADSGYMLIDLWIDDQKVAHKIAMPAKKVEVLRIR